MVMKLKYLISMLALAMVCAVGCTKDDNTKEQQRTSIERFLTSSHVPRLIDYKDIETSLDSEPQFYEKLSQDTYRYIATYYEEDRLSKAEVVSGSTVELRLTAYIFDGGSPKIEDIYYTNDEAKLAEMQANGLNPEFWSTEPLVLKLGSDKIIKGAELSLYGCREGDVVEAFMSMDAAYGSSDVGIIPSKSPVMWSYTILSVK